MCCPHVATAPAATLGSPSCPLHGQHCPCRRRRKEKRGQQFRASLPWDVTLQQPEKREEEPASAVLGEEFVPVSGGEELHPMYFLAVGKRSAYLVRKVGLLQCFPCVYCHCGKQTWVRNGSIWELGYLITVAPCHWDPKIWIQVQGLVQSLVPQFLWGKGGQQSGLASQGRTEGEKNKKWISLVNSDLCGLLRSQGHCVSSVLGLREPKTKVVARRRWQ